MTAPQPPVTPAAERPYTLAQMMPAPTTGGGPQPPLGTRPPKRRSGSVWLIAGLVIALGIGITAIAAAIGGGPSSSSVAGAPSAEAGCDGYAVDASSGAVVCKDATAADVVNSGPTYVAPRPSDFTIEVQVLRKKCFGSAGCNVTYRIAPSYVGTGALDPSATWLVTYEVRGVEGGPAVNTFEVTGGEARFDSEEHGQTPTTSVKLAARATQVLRG